MIKCIETHFIKNRSGPFICDTGISYLYEKVFAMGTAEFNLLREELIQWIKSLNDSKLLNFLNSVKLSTANPNQDWWDDLSEEQKQNIHLGLKDLNEGNTISSKDFWDQLRSNE